VDDHINWSDIVSGMNEAIHLIYVTLCPTNAENGLNYFTTQEGEEFKKIRGDLAGSKIPVAEYKFLWLKHIESYLKVVAKIPYTWWGTPRLFHGVMSRDKSEKLLSTCKSGTLLIRYSSRNSGICFSSRRSDGNIQHIELKCSDGNSFSIQWDLETRRRYASIDAIVWQTPIYLTFYPDIAKASILEKVKTR